MLRTVRGRCIPILTILLWLLAESPCRFAAETGMMEACALLVSRLIWVVTAVAVMIGGKKAFGVFALLCFASVVAVVPDLPREYDFSAVEFWFSVAGCFFKAAFLGGVTFGYLWRVRSTASV